MHSRAVVSYLKHGCSWGLNFYEQVKVVEICYLIKGLVGRLALAEIWVVMFPQLLISISQVVS